MTATKPGWYTAARSAQLALVAQIAHLAPYHGDLLSDWTPNMVGDCQGKAGWARMILTLLKWPPECIEMWCATLPDKRRHAVMVANVTLDDGACLAVAVDCMHETPMRVDDLGYSDWTQAAA